MSRTYTGAPSRPGWTLAAGASPEGQLSRRRWRILHNAKPRIEPPIGPMPLWVKTPENFVRWLASHLSLNQLYAYFRDLEAIAKLSYDLELLRFARRYLASNLAREFADDRERL
jgi:hypothetical protein